MYTGSLCGADKRPVPVNLFMAPTSDGAPRMGSAPNEKVGGYCQGCWRLVKFVQFDSLPQTKLAPSRSLGRIGVGVDFVSWSRGCFWRKCVNFTALLLNVIALTFCPTRFALLT